jgi:hypothetical protein
MACYVSSCKSASTSDGFLSGLALVDVTKMSPSSLRIMLDETLCPKHLEDYVEAIIGVRAGVSAV